MPQPLTYFVDRVFKNQRSINNTLQSAQTSTPALLTLSRPISSVLLGDEEVMVMEFFGVFWALEPDSSMTGFFTSEEAAIRYVRLKSKRYGVVFKASQNSSLHDTHLNSDD